MSETITSDNIPVIRVAIADDHQIFRKGVILSLRAYTNIKFVLEANNGQELLDGLEEAAPEVILMDLRMPVKDGIDTTRHISRKYPDIAIIILSMYEDDRFVMHMMENGASGYLLKSTEPQEIRKAILTAKSTGYYLNNYVSKIMLQKKQQKHRGAPSLLQEHILTDKEKGVLNYLCMEFTSSETAIKLKISTRTVETIRTRLMERFGAKNIAGLVFYAAKYNLVD
jgi:DNA-binding NarL/FixJ family response regulator